MKAVRRAALLLLTLGVVAALPRAAAADSINLLRPAAQGLSPSILIDGGRRPRDRDDRADSTDEDCVVVNDRDRTSSSRFGDVRWNFGQLTWDWNESDEPSLGYILCADPKRDASPLSGASGGAGFMAGLPWSGTQASTRTSAGDPPIPNSVGGERPSVTATVSILPAPGGSEFPAANGGAGTSSSMSSSSSLEEFTPVLALNDIFPSSTSLAIGSSRQFGGNGGFDSGGAFSGGNADAPMAPFDPPIALDPEEMAPVPEPGTLLLMGTGLAAAWRASRKRK